MFYHVLPSWWIWGSCWQWAGSQVCACNATLVTCCLGWWQPVFGRVWHRNTLKSTPGPPKVPRGWPMWRMWPWTPWVTPWTFRLWNATSGSIPLIYLISYLSICFPWLHFGLPVFSWRNCDIRVTSPPTVCSGWPWKACFARAWIVPAFISGTVVCIVVGDTWRIFFSKQILEGKLSSCTFLFIPRGFSKTNGSTKNKNIIHILYTLGFQRLVFWVFSRKKHYSTI